MRLAKCTRTHRLEESWEAVVTAVENGRLGAVGKQGTKVLRGNGAKAKVVSLFGCIGMAILNGLTYQREAACIVLAPSASREWTYFHLSLGDKDIHYQLVYRVPCVDVEETEVACVMGLTMDISNKKNAWKVQRDGLVPQDITRDVRLIIQTLVDVHYDKGEAK